MARWIERGHSIVCSACGEGKWKAYIPSVLIAYEWMKYCPQCGEKMEKEEESGEGGEE